MTSALFYDRLQFAFTATFHYLFPQLTMGLAALLLYLKSRAYWSRDTHYDEAAHFWTKIFALSFAFGVVTGIPLEFQFGMNWARFSTFAGGVIGQTLAMEGHVSGPAAVRQETIGSVGRLDRDGDVVPRVVALGVLHSGDECVDATSGGLCR